MGIRHKQNQLQLLEEGLKRIQEQEGSESIGGNLNIFLRDFSVILEALKVMMHLWKRNMRRNQPRYITVWRKMCLKIT